MYINVIKYKIHFKIVYVQKQRCFRITRNILIFHPHTFYMLYNINTNQKLKCYRQLEINNLGMNKIICWLFYIRALCWILSL